MKKTILTLTLLVLVLALAACNSTTVETQAENSVTNDNSENSNNNDDNPVNGENQFTIPVETAMMLGVVMLEETDAAVDADQASQLLPLWKALRSLGKSETAAQAELDAVFAQIEETMTIEQISTIAAMELTMQDTARVAEILGVELSNFGGRSGEITPEMQATREAARESGEFPGGGPGGGMGLGGGQGPGGQGGAEMDPAARETAIAERGGARGAGFGLNTVLLDAIIEFLEGKTQ